MGYTPKTLSKAYAEAAYKIYLVCEKRLDDLLMAHFPTLLRKKQLTIRVVFNQSHNSDVIFIGREYFPDNYYDAIVTLVKQKYAEWNIEYDEEKKQFTFFFDAEQESLLTLFRNAEERFKNLHLEEEDEDEEDVEYVDDFGNDDISF